MLISVIVPIYNSEKYLIQCIESIIKQTYTNIEIILVDDGSTDSSGRICDAYSKQDSRIKVIHKENGGVVSARKAGLEIANGEYTTAVDSDDWIDESMYEELVKVQQKTQADIITSGIYLENKYSTGKLIDNLEEGVYQIQNPSFLRNNFIIDMDTREYRINISICNKLIRKNIFYQCYFKIDNQLIWGEDMLSVITSILNSDKIAITNNLFYHYRQLETSSSHTRRISILREFGIAYEYLWNLFEKSCFSEILMELLQYIVLHKFFGQFNKVVFTPDKISIPIYLLREKEFGKYAKIIVYGAGAVGKSIYNQLKKEKYNIVGWIDRASDIYTKKGMPVENPQILEFLQFDKILICIKEKEDALSIKNELSERFGINEGKIVIADTIPFYEYCVVE